MSSGSITQFVFSLRDRRHSSNLVCRKTMIPLSCHVVHECCIRFQSCLNLCHLAKWDLKSVKSQKVPPMNCAFRSFDQRVKIQLLGFECIPPRICSYSLVLCSENQSWILFPTSISIVDSMRNKNPRSNPTFSKSSNAQSQTDYESKENWSSANLLIWLIV